MGRRPLRQQHDADRASIAASGVARFEMTVVDWIELPRMPTDHSSALLDAHYRAGTIPCWPELNFRFGGCRRHIAQVLPHRLQQLGEPVPATAEIRKKGSPSAFTCRSSRSIVSRSTAASICRRGNQLRLAAELGARTAKSSRRIVSKSSIGSRPDSPDTSTSATSSFGAIQMLQEPIAESMASSRLQSAQGHRRRRSCDLPSSKRRRGSDERGERIIGKSSASPPRCARSTWICRVRESTSPTSAALQMQLKLLGLARRPSSNRLGARLTSW